MAPSRWSGKKTDAAIGGTKISLQFVKELASAIPAPCVGAAVGAALKLIEILECVEANASDCRDLQQRVGNVMAVVMTPLQGKTDADISQELKGNIGRLSDTLLKMQERLGGLTMETRSKLRRFLVSQKNTEKLRSCREDLAWAMREFQVEANIQTQLDAARRHLEASKQRSDILEAVQGVASRMQQLTLGPAGPNRQVLPSHPASNLPSLQLPAAPEIFYGREGFVGHVVDLLLKNRQARVFICGSGGIGKTSLALTAAHHPDVVERFGARRHWVPCDQAPSPDAFVQLVARSMDIIIPSTSNDPFKNLVAIIQAGEVMDRLLILDNFETTWDTKRQPEVRTTLCTLAATKGISIIMTTRDAGSTAFGLAWSRPLPCPVGQLTPDAARAAYLHHHPDAEHDELLDHLLKALDYYPLAITLMASQGALGERPSSLLARWEDEKSKLLGAGPDKHTNLELSMALSVNSQELQEDPGALQTLSMLALLPAGTTVDMLPQLPDLRRHVFTLVKVSLAYRQADSGRIGTLSPIRAYILKRYPPSNDILVHVGAMYNQHVLSWRSNPPGSDVRRDASGVISLEEPNIESVLRYSMVNGDQQKIFTAVVDYTEYLSWCHPNPHLLHFALDQVSSGVVPPADNARAYQTLGYTLGQLGNYHAAKEAFQIAESSFKTTGNCLGAARCKRALGQVFTGEGHLLEATKMLQEAQETFKIAGALADAARCQLILGDPLTQESRYAEAKETLQSALAYFEADGLLWEVATTQLRLGEVLQKEGEEYVKAERLLQEALATFQGMGDAPSIANCLFYLGQVMYGEGRVVKASELVESALIADRKVGHLTNIGLCEERLRQWSMA